MKAASAIVLACLGMAAAVSLGGKQAARTAPSSPRSKIRIDRPETWEPAVKRTQAEVDRIAHVLVATAKDEKRPYQQRRKAILLLGKIGNDKSLDFLIANVSLRMDPDLILGDKDVLLGTSL